MSLIRRGAGPALLALCALCLILQVLVRPAVGLSNNGGDFPKMAGAFGLGPEVGSWETHKQYGEFVYHYLRADRFVYNRDFHTAEFVSSEYFLIKLARGLQRLFHPGPRFDIRWLGAVGCVFFLLAIGIWIYALPPGLWRLFVGLFLILVWTDVAYAQYLNSFYMDTPGMIFLVLSVGAGLHVARHPNSRVFAVAMAAGAILFAVSKSQHALPAFLFIPLFAAYAFWTRDRLARVIWIAGSVVLAIGATVVLGRNTDEYRAVPVYTVVFWRLAPAAPDPLRALQELGLGKTELPLLHTYAYQPQAPMGNPEWVRQFHARCNYSTLLRYYFRHPSVPARFIYEDLSDAAVHIRPWANLSPEDGFPLDSQSAHFTLWSDFRSFLFRHAPWHVILLMLVTVAGALWLFFQSPADRALAGLMLIVQAIAAVECATASLADNAETLRHLFMFHVATEISILLLPLWVARIVGQFRQHDVGQASSLPIATSHFASGH
ncbi:MAG TPA: hypothetical protein VGF16_03505 [Bryobacteraceae bacterium]